MEFGSQDLSFGDFSSLSPEEHDKIYAILHRTRATLARKVEFPWDNVEQFSREATLTVKPAELEHGGPTRPEDNSLPQDTTPDGACDFRQTRDGGSTSLDPVVTANCVVNPDLSGTDSVYNTYGEAVREGSNMEPSGSGSSGSARGSIDRSREATPTDSNDGNSDTGDGKSRERNSGRLMASLKTYERRNKKRRPPDYYERLAQEVNFKPGDNYEEKQRENIGYSRHHLEDSGYSDGPGCRQPVDATPHGHHPVDAPPHGHQPVDAPPHGHQPVDALPHGHQPPVMVMPGGHYSSMVPMFGVPPGMPAYAMPFQTSVTIPMHHQGMPIMAGHHLQQQHGLVGMPPHSQLSGPPMSNHMSGPPPNQMSHSHLPPPNLISGPPSRNVSGPPLRVQMAPPHITNQSQSSQLPPNQMSGQRQMSGPSSRNQVPDDVPRNEMSGPSFRSEMSVHATADQMSESGNDNQMPEPPRIKQMSEPLRENHEENMLDSRQSNQVEIPPQQSRMYSETPPHPTSGQPTHSHISSPPGFAPVDVIQHREQTTPRDVSLTAQPRSDRHPPGFIIRPNVPKPPMHTEVQDVVTSAAPENRQTNRFSPRINTTNDGIQDSEPQVDRSNVNPPLVAGHMVPGVRQKSPSSAQIPPGNTTQTYARETGTNRALVQPTSNNSNTESNKRNRGGSLGNTVGDISEDLPPRTSGHNHSSDNSILADGENLTFLQESMCTGIDTVVIENSSVAPEPMSPESKGVSDAIVQENTAKSKDSALPEGTDSQSPVSEAPSVEPVNKPKVGSWAGLFKSSGSSSRPSTVSWAMPGASSVGSALSNNLPDNNKQSDVSGEIQPPVLASEDSAAKQLGGLLFAHVNSFVSTPLQPRGLMNRGNWCYVNATLQALIACPAFNNLLKQLPRFPALTRGPSSTPILDNMVEFVNEFTSMQLRPVEKTEKGKKKVVSQELVPGAPFEPSYVYKMLQMMECSSSFKGGKQEDAEEFLSCVLNGVHDEMAAVMSQVSDKHKQINYNTEVEADTTNGYLVNEGEGPDEKDDQWEQVGPRNKSVFTRKANFTKTPISDIFAGQIRSAVFQAGSRESAMLEPFFTLQLDIQSEKVWTVKDALEGLVSKENVQGFTCSKTKTQVEVTRRLTLEELPPVLVLHLKFFVYDKSGGSQKLLKKIDYATELEISRDLLSPNVRSKLPTNQRMYKLFAVVYHHGKNVTGGHYTTDVYHSGVSSWVHIDDNNVRQVNLQQVLKFVSPRVPYLLYYRRMDLA